MNVIEIKNLTKDYGNNKGIFDVNLCIKPGEMVGFVGTNGSGKTTTIRSILGFIKPTSGNVKVMGLSSWENSSEIVSYIGYVPGEIAFPDLATGVKFLKSQAELLKLKDMSYADKLIKDLQLDIKANLKRMSKGMKQKTAIVSALMNDSPIIILDEPTTGLDPLMRAKFLEIIKEEHKKGKTILMSSHMVEELEETCDRVALINSGKIVNVADMNEIRNRKSTDFKIEFKNETDFLDFLNQNYEILRIQKKYNQVTIRIEKKQVSKLLDTLNKYDLKFIFEIPYTLEKHFNEVLKENENEKTI